jgi:hypothetical protein
MLTPRLELQELPCAQGNINKRMVIVGHVWAELLRGWVLNNILGQSGVTRLLQNEPARLLARSSTEPVLSEQQRDREVLHLGSDRHTVSANG